jgi:hypothetical protein
VFEGAHPNFQFSGSKFVANFFEAILKQLQLMAVEHQANFESSLLLTELVTSIHYQCRELEKMNLKKGAEIYLVRNFVTFTLNYDI